MKPLPGPIESALESEQFRQCHLIDIEIADTDLHLTDWTIPLLYSDILYLPRGMKIEPIKYSSSTIVDKVNIDFDDVDRVFYEALGELELGDFVITIKLAVLDEISKVQAVLTLFDGSIDQWEYVPGTVRMSVVSRLYVKWARSTTLRYSSSCRWKVFKGDECGYVGDATTCDRSYSQCYKKENFGGFRWIPSMINKKIEV